MQSLFKPLPVTRFDPLGFEDVHALLENARRLERAATALELGSLLCGKNLGLLCDTEAADDAMLFRRAAEDLGARVAHIHPSLSTLSSARLDATARTLGRLYDAVECQGFASGLVRQIGDAAGIPVYDGIGSPRHPIAGLAELLDTGTRAERRCRILQAALMSTLL
jgi:ornithine carbamoyltransferase